MREAEARIPTVANHCMAVTSDAIKVDPAIEPVDCRRISMNGYPVGDFWAASTSLLLNNIAINMPNPIQPFTKSVAIIDRGITRAAF